MKKFLTVFKFTYMKSIKNMNFIVFTFLGIAALGLFFNYQSVMNFVDTNMKPLKELISIDKTNIIALVDHKDSLGITQDILDSYPYQFGSLL